MQPLSTSCRTNHFIVVLHCPKWRKTTTRLWEPFSFSIQAPDALSSWLVRGDYELLKRIYATDDGKKKSQWLQTTQSDACDDRRSTTTLNYSSSRMQQGNWFSVMNLIYGKLIDSFKTRSKYRNNSGRSVMTLQYDFYIASYATHGGDRQ